MPSPDLRRLLADQSGVVSRTQALAGGLDDNDIERLLRRRGWARVHPGVYVDHTGVPTWDERAWAAVLACWPAALAGASALRAHGLRSEMALAGRDLRVRGFEAVRPGGRPAAPDPVVVAVDHARRVTAPDGVVVVRRVGLEGRALLQLGPPRLRLEEALLDVASDATTPADAVAMLADACQEGRTTAARLAQSLHARGRLTHRKTLLVVLDDVATGALSAFEHRYLVDVERRHALPRAARQSRLVVRDGVTFRDVHYWEQRTVLELDGRLAHSRARRIWADLDRDIESAVVGEVSLRLGWGHVLEPCRTAERVGRLLVARGWTGRPRACGPLCAADPHVAPRLTG
ncbi:MAG: hypothetical protein JWP82_1253 [Humibacillus sp.]|nr:hypothetical protein [Humibacillus sp.]